MQKQDENVKKNLVIYNQLDRMVEDLVVMFEETYRIKLKGANKEIFVVKAKGVLVYWAGLIYDDANSHVKNLESALDTSYSINRVLRQSEQNLLAISSSLSTNPPDSSLLTGLQKQMGIQNSLLISASLPNAVTTEENQHTRNTVKMIPLFPDIPDHFYRFSQQKLEQNMRENVNICFSASFIDIK